MYVSFDHIDKTAKSWVYSLEKKCSNHIQDLDFFLKEKNPINVFLKTCKCLV